MEHRKSRDEARRQFGEELGGVLAARGIRQTKLAEMMDTTQSTVSAWISGRSEPAVETVFELEDRLSLPPGSLSRFLDYLPVVTDSVVPTLVDAIALSNWSLESKRMVLTVIRTVESMEHQTQPQNRLEAVT